MSGLGTTVQPDGEPGSVAHAVIPQSETIPDNPATISQTTAIQTLEQLLNGNWIYDSTFTASTTMPAGTVVFVKPIHPGEWNWPNRKVATMFNAWTGSGKIRYRPLATAWYGGSIRVGFLPPNIRQGDIQNIPLEILTSYPNKDIDPKNTQWVEFQTPDQRDVQYHYMAPFDDTDVRNFGGYVVFYVAGKLVTQAPEFTTIQFIVETAGNFMYDQPGPNALDSAGALPNPVSIAGDIPLHLHPILDSMESGADNVLQVLPSSVNSLPAGGLGVSAVGVPNALIGGIPGLTSLSSVVNSEVLKESSSNGWMVKSALVDGMRPKPNRKAQFNKEFGTTCYLANFVVGAGTSVNYMNISGLDLVTDAQIDIKFDQQATTSVSGIVNIDHMTFLPNDATTPINPALTPIGAMTLQPVVAGESIVVFGNLVNRSYAVQTEILAQQIGAFQTDGSRDTTSYLYNVVNSAGTPLLVLRLNPNGIFTTNAASVNIVYPSKGLKFRYIGTLPVSSPLPPSGVVPNNIRRLAARISRKPLTSEALQILSEELAMY